MKHLLILSFILSGSLFYAQKIEYNTNRDPIKPQQTQGLRMSPPSKTSGVILCKNNDSSKDPLIIFDGKEISKKELDSIDPNTIESMSVLKNENAVAQYGEKAKNGVIIIQSKRKTK